MSMKYMTMMLGPVMTNCYIVYDSETKDAMVVDPAWDYDKINQALEDHQLHLKSERKLNDTWEDSRAAKWIRL